MSESPNDRLSERVDFRDLLSNLDQLALWMGDEDGFDYLSPGFEDIWGVSAEAVQEDMSVMFQHVHPDDLEAVLAAVEDEEDRLAEGESTVLEHRIVRPDGEVRWVEARTFPIHDASGNQTQVVGVSLDITDRKRAELELEDQIDRLERFASVVSHDLRNPLNAAQGYLQLAEEECEYEHQYHDPIERALDRIGTLITSILTLARRGYSIERERVDVAEAARAAWSMAGRAGATLAVDDDLGAVSADPSLVQQLFENTFRNAIEHGGRDVTVRVGPLADGNGFYVADDGPGIPEPDRERLFDEGYSVSKDGVSLGTMIIKQIVDAHGWTIDVTDAADGGARFEIANVEPVE